MSSVVAAEIDSKTDFAAKMSRGHIETPPAEHYLSSQKLYLTLRILNFGKFKIWHIEAAMVCTE